MDSYKVDWLWASLVLDGITLMIIIQHGYHGIIYYSMIIYTIKSENYDLNVMYVIVAVLELQKLCEWGM